MGMRPDWPARPVRRAAGDLGPNAADVAALVGRAMVLTRSEIVRLDIAERANPGLLLATWQALCDALAAEPEHGWRLAARDAAWRAVREAGAHCDIDVPPDDGYWHVRLGVGCGAARAARYAACAIVAPERLDPDTVEVLLRPWRTVIG